MLILFRADANEKIATGHVMRCVAIAREFLIRGYEVCFLVADQVSQKAVEAQGMSTILLNTRWDDMESEIPKVIAILRKYAAAWLFVDSYYVTEKYFREVRPWTKVAYVDDLHLFHYDCDAIINYSVYASVFKYQDEYIHTRLLLGCDYVPLRSDFRDISVHKICDTVTDVLLLTGGGDEYHVALKLVYEVMKHLYEWDDITFHIVCGRFSPDREELERKSHELENIKIYSHVEHIEKLMQTVDIAISAGGSTLYELCACGTPTITYSMADNQLRNVKKFDQLGLMDYSGDVRDGFEYEDLLKRLSELADNCEKRAKQSRQTRQMVDGLGARRIAEALSEISGGVHR